MAESRAVVVVPLKGPNYATWKIQCRMALMKEGLWGIVTGTEEPPSEEDAEKYAKFVAKRDRTLALIVLSVDPTLLYLLGDPEDPVKVWRKLSDHFQKKTWANKLELRRRLYSLRLKEGDSVQEHIRKMTEVFEELAVVGDPLKEEDQVVYLLASLPESYDMLVTALEANAEVPHMEVVMERLLHEEKKQKERDDDREQSRALASYSRGAVKCFHCGKPGHIRRNCPHLDQEEKKPKQFARRKDGRHKANKASRTDHESDSENDLLVVGSMYTLQASTFPEKWIVDSGATCHMCCDRMAFEKLQPLDQPLKVSLGDGRQLNAVGEGVILLRTRLPNGKFKKCKLWDVLYIPALAYNLLSVSKAAEKGNTATFSDNECQILNADHQMIAKGVRCGNLYYLDCQADVEAHAALQESQEDLWHRRYGHLGVQSLQRLARGGLVKGLNYNPSKGVGFCRACVEGKHKKTPFQVGEPKRAAEPLDLVHSDVCGKLNVCTMGGAEYFVTFIDDCTRYIWVYLLKRKSDVFKCFKTWKALVENLSGKKLKMLRTDRGGEYTSSEFEEFLRSVGVRHERTIPKTPEQNGVAERCNRTLVEMVRSMLLDSKLPQKFWGEALSTAVYLRNRSPTKVLSDRTPYEAWTGGKPEVGHLRVFGCEAYTHVPKENRKKLDAKARKCVLVGYGEETKGYRLFDPSRMKVIYSRDVVFNEADIERQSDEIASEEEFVELDLLNDEARFELESEAKSPAPVEPVEESPPTLHQSLEPVTRRPAPVEPVEKLPPPTPHQSLEPGTRRSTRARNFPDYYGWSANLINVEPSSVQEAMSSREKPQWREAMQKEMHSLEVNCVWELTELPEGRQPVGCKWVFKTKTDADGKIERYKARLVAQGFSQRFGCDYDETFSPVVRLESVRTLIAMSTQHNLQMHQVDVTTAFLNGELEEEVYMAQPEGFISSGQEHLVCRLKKSIYGLKQSPRCWNTALDMHLKKLGFVATSSDPCIYRSSEGELCLLGIYVDDIILAAKSTARLEEVKKGLAKKFDIKDMGTLHYFLGMKVIRDDATGKVWIGQPGYTKSLLKRYGMEAAKPVDTPVDTSTKLVAMAEDDESLDQTLYQSAVGSLMYLAVATRPDITFAVSNVAKFSAQPAKHHWTAVKRVMRYLRGTTEMGLVFSPQPTDECVGYSDADWGGDLDDRKSTSGYLFQVGGGAVSWRSKKQTCVALSTAEAEYIALAAAAQEALWLRQLTAEFKMSDVPLEATTIHEDNQSTISMAKNPQFHGRTKHIAIKYHFIRDLVSDGVVELKYCPTKQMVADLLTKGLPRDQFSRLREMAGIACYDFSSGSK